MVNQRTKLTLTMQPSKVFLYQFLLDVQENSIIIYMKYSISAHNINIIEHSIDDVCTQTHIHMFAEYVVLKYKNCRRKKNCWVNKLKKVKCVRLTVAKELSIICLMPILFKEMQCVVYRINMRGKCVYRNTGPNERCRSMTRHF